MTIAQFILFLMKYDLKQKVELVQARQEHSGLVLRFKGLPAKDAIEEQDKEFLKQLSISVGD